MNPTTEPKNQQNYQSKHLNEVCLATISISFYIPFSFPRFYLFHRTEMQCIRVDGALKCLECIVYLTEYWENLNRKPLANTCIS